MSPRRVRCSWALLQGMAARGVQPDAVCTSIRVPGPTFDAEYLYRPLWLATLSDRSFYSHGGQLIPWAAVRPVAPIAPGALCVLELEPLPEDKGAPPEESAPEAPRHNLQGGKDAP